MLDENFKILNLDLKKLLQDLPKFIYQLLLITVSCNLGSKFAFEIFKSTRTPGNLS